MSDNELEDFYENCDNTEELCESIIQPEANIPKRRTNVGPWRNKEEFDEVYLWLFASDMTNETKLKACKRMTIWKLRSLNLTPASILGTLALVETQLKDECNKSPDDMQLLYAGAFTRFLNYMSSTGQKGRMKTMYQVAMDIGIDPFIVDLRHLCAHGQVMPSIDVLRRASDYCLSWLKEYYWDHEYKNMVNVDATFLQKEEIALLDNHLKDYLLAYDVLILSQHKNCTTVKELKNNVGADNFNLLQKFGKIKENFKISQIQDVLIKKLESVIRRELNSRNFVDVFIVAFTNMNYIFDIPAKCLKRNDEIKIIIKSSRSLFRLIAMYGLIERFFEELINICENNFAIETRREGASFWANQIVLGYLALIKFKFYCKEQKDINDNFSIEKKNFNNVQGLSKEIRKIYSKLGIDSNSVIIFGQHYKKPWCLSFSENYIEERLKNISNYTKNIIKNCLSLVDPPLPKTKIKMLEEIIKIYCRTFSKGKTKEKKNLKRKYDSKFIYCLDKGDECKVRLVDINNYEVTKTRYGIWYEPDDGYDWHLCPLGRLPWD